MSDAQDAAAGIAAQPPPPAAVLGANYGPAQFNRDSAEIDAAQKQAAVAKKPIIEKTLKNVADEQARFDKMAADYTPVQETKAPPVPENDPLKGFASVASVFAMVASAFTHTPAINAMNGMASAINATKANDWAAYKAGYDQWKENTELAIKNHELQAKDMQLALSTMQTELSTGMAQANAAAAAADDVVAAKLLSEHRLEEYGKLMDERARLGLAMKEYALRVDEHASQETPLKFAARGLTQTQAGLAAAKTPEQRQQAQTAVDAAQAKYYEEERKEKEATEAPDQLILSHQIAANRTAGMSQADAEVKALADVTAAKTKGTPSQIMKNAQGQTVLVSHGPGAALVVTDQYGAPASAEGLVKIGTDAAPPKPGSPAELTDAGIRAKMDENPGMTRPQAAAAYAADLQSGKGSGMSPTQWRDVMDHLRKDHPDADDGELALMAQTVISTAKKGNPGFDKPVSVLVERPDGGTDTVLAEHNKQTGGWVTADQDRTPIQGIVKSIPKTGAGLSAQDPSVETTAQAIANYQQAPLTAYVYGRLGPEWASAVQKRITELNPDYSPGQYAAFNATLKAFDVGPEGRQIRSVNVAVQHLSVLLDLADALHNHDLQAANYLGNLYAEQAGDAAPTSYDEAKSIIGQETVKAIIVGGGGVTERQAAADNLGRSLSPDQIRGVVNNAVGPLMAGQVQGLRQQFKSSTGLPDRIFDSKVAPSTKAFIEAAQKKVGSGSGIPKEAQDILRADPSIATRAHFDEVFGAGAAARVLGH